MIKLVPLILATLMSPSLHAQDVKKETKGFETKMEMFSSKLGVITKFIDTKLPDLKLYFSGAAETRIRKVISGSESSYFYQIVNQGKYSTNTASIEYSDLIEIIKALKALKGSAEQDISADQEYIENKFVSTDGFQVGYYVSKGKCNWFLRLEKYTSDNTLFIKDGADLETAFLQAKIKIEELRK